jgi:hypothetical protein
MRKLIAVMLLFSMHCLHAQDPKLPTILPPTPEAASITKGAELTAGLYNGAMKSAIPLADIKMSDFNLPISLSYSSNGTKVDEIPSREGLNWSLDAGGVITRIVNGKPDDQTTPYLPTTDLGSATYRSVAYNHYLTDDTYNYDAEPDEFRIAGPGISGKFVLDTSGNAILIPYSNLKVQVNRLVTAGPYYEIIVTNTEGIKFYFGGTGAVEETTNHNIAGKLSGFTQVTTGFFLRKIELLNKDSINFYYSILATQNVTGVTHMVRVDKGLSQGVPCGDDHCPSGGSYFSSSVSEVYYNSRVLDSIKAANGSRVLFYYAMRPDGSDNRLTGVHVYENVNIKKYKLLYEDPSCGGYNHEVAGQINKRFFLKQLQKVGEDNSSTTDTLNYRFEYIDKTALPDRLSFCQDHYGFFNGQDNTTLLPDGFGTSDYGGYAEANREPDGDFAMIGMLNKITYPTGGSDSIIYGKNTFVSVTPQSYTASLIIDGQGTGSGTVQTFLSDSMFVKRDHTASLFMEASEAMSCSACTPPDEGIDRIVDVRIKDLTANTYNRRILYEFTNITEPFSFLANHVYQIELKVMGDYSYGYVNLSYDSSLSQTYTSTTHDAPGVHVNEIRSYDPVANRTTHKYYKYTSVNNLSGSSALKLYSLNYNSNAYSITWNSCWMGDYFICYSDILSSNSNASQYFYDNNAYVFTSVLMSDDPNFKTGVTEHQFAAEAFNYGTTILGDEIFQMPSNTNSWYHGIELATNFYDSSLNLVRSTNNYFHVDTAGQKSRTGIIIRKKYDWPLYDSAMIGDDDVDPYDIGIYTYQSNWIQQDSSVTKEYDPLGHVLVSKTTNYYGNPSNVLPIRVENLDSKGLVLKEERKYPTDSAIITPYQRMIDKNIITPVIQSSSYRDNNLVNTVKNNYFDYSESQSTGYAVLIKPQTIQVQKGSGPLETRVRFSKYDTKGNIVEMSKENDIRLSYLWDYEMEYPIAEVRNADSAYVAATSFEADGKGNWSFSGTPATDNTAPTGVKAYVLNGSNNISKTGLNSSSTYIVSYWTKNSSAFSITGTISGYPISGRTVDGWKYFEHHVTGQTTISVGGSGSIDELRLYPISAQMATCTYFPLVGITSQCDINNRIIYYQYDNMGRLVIIRDQDKNIVKRFCYSYAGEAISCQLFASTDQSGNYYKQNCPAGQSAVAYYVNVPAGMFMSGTSVFAANTRAQQWAQQKANDEGSCAPLIAITSSNSHAYEGFMVEFYDGANNRDYYFEIPAGASTLGYIEAGSYDIYIWNVSDFTSRHFTVCGSTQEGEGTATFMGVTINSGCHSVTISN